MNCIEVSEEHILTLALLFQVCSFVGETRSPFRSILVSDHPMKLIYVVSAHPTHGFPFERAYGFADAEVYQLSDIVFFY